MPGNLMSRKFYKLLMPIFACHRFNRIGENFGTGKVQAINQKKIQTVDFFFVLAYYKRKK